MDILKEIAEICESEPCHWSLDYGHVTDYHLRIWKGTFDRVDDDIFDEQDTDLDYLLCRGFVKLRDWRFQKHHGY